MRGESVTGGFEVSQSGTENQENSRTAPLRFAEFKGCGTQRQHPINFGVRHPPSYKPVVTISQELQDIDITQLLKLLSNFVTNMAVGRMQLAKVVFQPVSVGE